MNKLFKKFREKYKVQGCKEIRIEEQQDEENQAADLALKLNAVFVTIPMLKPYEGEVDKVKLSQEHINIILDVINTSNKIILENQFYGEVKEILQKVLEQNENGILINAELSIQSRTINKFSNSLQLREYWEEKSF